MRNQGFCKLLRCCPSFSPTTTNGLFLSLGRPASTESAGADRYMSCASFCLWKQEHRLVDTDVLPLKFENFIAAASGEHQQADSRDYINSSV
jgi:hypothetical protein